MFFTLGVYGCGVFLRVKLVVASVRPMVAGVRLLEFADETKDVINIKNKKLVKKIILLIDELDQNNIVLKSRAHVDTLTCHIGCLILPKIKNSGRFRKFAQPVKLVILIYKLNLKFGSNNKFWVKLVIFTITTNTP